MNSSEKNEILVAFGGNIPSPVGSPDQTILAALEVLSQKGVAVEVHSPFYRTKAVTLPGQVRVPSFTNSAARMSSELPARDVLVVFQKVERFFGRMPSARWSSRPLDIDLLAMGRKVLPDREGWNAVAGSDDPAAILPEPVVPHPRLHIRGFVLAPLVDIAPDWVHPILDKSVQSLFEDARNEGLLDDVERFSP